MPVSLTLCRRNILLSSRHGANATMLVHADLPKPDRVVHFEAYSRSGHPNPDKTGALFVFGDLSSPKTALLCPGYADDQTVFLPFAKKLADAAAAPPEGSGVLVGVVCMPGYDDRPEDGVPWTSHPRDGFSFEETAKTIRLAARTLRATSTHESPELIGIFHDWGCVVGAIWAKQLEEESKDSSVNNNNNNNNNNNSVVDTMPDKIVYFDVLLGPPSWAKTDPIPESDIRRPGFMTNLASIYQLCFAASSTLYSYVSRLLGTGCFAGFAMCLHAARIAPLYSWDNNDALYGPARPGPLRLTQMAYPYRTMIADIFLRGKSIALHEDLKSTPILYLHGTDKRASFHSPIAVALLEREHAEQRSLCNSIAVRGAGHWLYNQKQEECLGHVLDFVNAENSFRTKP